MIKCIIFDLDDTLYDELNYIKSGFWAVSSDLALHNCRFTAKQFYDAMYFHFAAGNRHKTFDAVCKEFELPLTERLIASLVEIYRSHNPRIFLPQESRRMLELLKDKYTLAMLTDGFLPAQQLKVAALDVEKYFQMIVYTEQLGREHWKPSTKGFEMIMQKFSLPAEQCVYVADNCDKDFIAPNKLAMKSVRIIRPNGLHISPPANKEAAASETIINIEDLPDILKTM